MLEAFARTGREPWDHPLLGAVRLRPGAARFVLDVRDRLVSLAELRARSSRRRTRALLAGR